LWASVVLEVLAVVAFLLMLAKHWLHLPWAFFSGMGAALLVGLVLTVLSSPH
jgi:hypothetical protein